MFTTTPIRETGLNMPQIVFGTSCLGNMYEAISYGKKHKIISQWFEQTSGLIAVDCAGKYGAGLALESLGRSFEELGIDPTQVVISNKLGWLRVELESPEPTFEPGVWVDLQHDAILDISYEGILRCWEQGCELLGDYRPELVSVHDPDEFLAAATTDAQREDCWENIIGAYRALAELRDSGQVAAIGIGSKDWRVSQKLLEHCDLDWVMLANSFTVYRHEPELIEFIGLLHQRNISVINSAIFHSGFLTGGDYFDYRKVTGCEPGDVELFEWRSRFHRICQEFGIEPAVACFSFAAAPAGVVAVVLNTSRPERVQSNVALVDAVVPNEFWLAMQDATLIQLDNFNLFNQSAGT